MIDWNKPIQSHEPYNGKAERVGTVENNNDGFQTVVKYHDTSVHRELFYMVNDNGDVQNGVPGFFVNAPEPERWRNVYLNRAGQLEFGSGTYNRREHAELHANPWCHQRFLATVKIPNEPQKT